MTATITHVYFGPVNGQRNTTRRLIADLFKVSPQQVRLSECLPHEAPIKAALCTKRGMRGLCAADVAAELAFRGVNIEEEGE